jgi:hypothetical protein
MTRWIGFLIAISLGIAAGLAYGWVINPVEYVDTTPDSLRIDFKSDYVLMVAEIFQAEGDVGLAARRLAFLGDDPPLEIAQDAIDYARQAGYSETDRRFLVTLRDTLQTWNPTSSGVLEP